MTSSEDLQPAFVLHSRPWRETSLLVDIFSQNHGKLGLCARGVRNKKSPKRSILQPFTPLLLSWKGRGDLPTMTQLEPAAASIQLKGDPLFSAFYINELLVRLLHRHDPHPQLYNHYHQTLQALSTCSNVEQILREFELNLLSAMGYGLTLNCDMDGEPIVADREYLLNQDGVFQQVEQKLHLEPARLFAGHYLISIANNNWQNMEVLKVAKRLMRFAMQPLLGDKPLQSRKLFRRKKSYDQ
ncbi:MAG: DNA repair protein RecO [Gammaproteobacteria bacterium]|nr:MAG: DNA repair protein RecO [Gammaproteobacteria bacterium]